MKGLLTIPLLLLLLGQVHAQSPSFIFQNIGERQGLSANFCYSMLKDSRGMLWVGTVNGLNRFDGVHFNRFFAGDDSTSFINNSIIDLCEDKDGNIWGATSSGIFCYLPHKNAFVNYIPPTYDFARNVKNIICDRKGEIWATTEWNILKLNKQKKKFEEIEPLTRNYDSLSAYSVRQNGLIEDPSGNGLWFATRRGLHFYNTSEEKFYNYKSHPNDSLFTSHSVAAISLSASGNVWFFDNVSKDIICFDPKTHKLLQRINMSATIPNAIGATLFEDSNHMLWFSTWGNNMLVMDYRNKKVHTISHKIDNPLTVAGDNFWAVWEDQDNNIWLATPGGLSRCNYSKNVFSITPIVEQVPEFKNSKLGAFKLDPAGKGWWIASEDKVNLIRFYPETGKYDFFDFSKAIPNSKGQMPGPVFDIAFVEQQPFVCTYTGVWRVNEKTRQLHPFEKKFEGLANMHYDFVTEQGDDVWFMANEGHIKWNKKSNRAILIKAPVDSLPDGQRTDYGKLFFDDNQTPWYVSAFGWLAHINKKNEVVLKYYIKNKAKELSGYITSVTKDTRGNFWMTASGGIGLYSYNVASGEMKLYNQQDGIPNYIHCALADRENRIWIAAGNKFSVFSPDTKNITQYDLPLYAHTLNYNNVLQSDSIGNMIVTVYKDIVQFSPERMNLKPNISAPLLSSVMIAGKEKLLADETSIQLEPFENALEFSFGSLISHEVFPYSLEYKLVGFDKDWKTANAAVTALYNNLKSGSYTFLLRAVAKDKSWQSPERSLLVTIRTPFYKASWFLLLMAGIVLGAMVLFYRFRLHNQKQILTLETKAEALEKEKTLIQYESLKQQLNPHFLFNSLTSLRSLIKTDSKTASSFLDGLSKVYRYVLKSADLQLVLVKEEATFVTTFAELQKVRFGEGFQVNIHISEQAGQQHIAPVVLQNLLENAIKHNTTSTDSPLMIDIFDKDDYLHVRNNLQRYRIVETSNKQGLQSLKKLYSFYTDKQVLIAEDDQYFTISIPLL